MFLRHVCQYFTTVDEISGVNDPNYFIPIEEIGLKFESKMSDPKLSINESMTIAKLNILRAHKHLSPEQLSSLIQQSQKM